MALRVAQVVTVLDRQVVVVRRRLVGGTLPDTQVSDPLVDVDQRAVGQREFHVSQRHEAVLVLRQPGQIVDHDRFDGRSRRGALHGRRRKASDLQSVGIDVALDMLSVHVDRHNLIQVVEVVRLVVELDPQARGLVLNEFAVSPHGRGRAAQNCGTVVRGKRMGICRAILIRRRTAEFCAVQGERQKRLIGGFGRALDILPGLAAIPADLPLQRGRGRAGDFNGQSHVFTAFDHAADILRRAGEFRHIADGHAAVRLGIVLIPADGHSLHLRVLGYPKVELSAAVGGDTAVVKCRIDRKSGKGDILYRGVLFRKGQGDLFQFIAVGIFHDRVHRNIQIDTAAVDDNVGTVDRAQTEDQAV